MKIRIRKFTAVFLAVIMLLTIVPVIDFSGEEKSAATVEAKEVFTSGYCGDTSGGQDGKI